MNAPVTAAQPQDIQERLYRIQKEHGLKSDGYLFRAKLLLGEICEKLSQQGIRGDAGDTGARPNRNVNSIINELIIYMQNNYNRNISLEELGKLVNLHPRYLCTLFRQVSGKNVGDLICEIRIEKAKRLLLYTSLSITEIALDIGFSDSQYFSKVFHRSEGLSPSAYRKNRLMEIE